MHDIIKDLQWRYAVKRFDPERKIDGKTMEIIRESLRLVPTSYGLQAMKFLFIETRETREQLQEASYGQQQITDASHLLVMCAYKDILPVHIDEHIDNITTTREMDEGSLAGYGDFLKRSMSDYSAEYKTNWNSKQVYIALGQLLTVCAHLKVDAIPMEGFDKKRYDEILGLAEKNLTSVLVCPLGYRHPEDEIQYKAKVRKPQENLFETY